MQLLEPAEVTEKRNEEIARLLAEYRASRGLDRRDSEATLQSASEELDAGNQLMSAGRLAVCGGCNGSDHEPPFASQLTLSCTHSWQRCGSAKR